MDDVQPMKRLGSGQLSRMKRRANRAASAEVLRQRGVAFQPRLRNPAQWVVRANGRTADFWPGTGRWEFRREDVKGRGVFNLLLALGVEEKSNA